MSSRRHAREQALQILFQLDYNFDVSSLGALKQFEDHFAKKKDEEDPFVKKLVQGVVENLQDIDEILGRYSEHWRLNRMPSVDRNVLRLGVYELEYCDDIPATVTVNEMVELAKMFGGENSGSFINGVLDKVMAGNARPGKAP